MASIKIKTLFISMLFMVAYSTPSISQDKYVTKFPLSGVEGSPTFGMTENEKITYNENIQMCKNQFFGETTFVDDQTRLVFSKGHIHYFLKIEGQTLVSSSSIANGRYSDIDTLMTKIRTDLTNRNISYGGYPVKLGSYRPDLNYQTSSGGWTYLVFEVMYYRNSPNYTWCKDNGFKTGN